MHSSWRYCTGILLKGLNLKIVLIKLVDDVLRNCLSKLVQNPSFMGGWGGGKG